MNRGESEASAKRKVASDERSAKELKKILQSSVQSIKDRRRACLTATRI